MDGLASAFYLPLGPADDGGERFASTSAIPGPWTSQAAHGGPPAALLGRAIERATGEGRTVGRFTMDFLGPIGVGTLAVRAEVLRPGRSVSLVAAEILDEDAGRICARAQAWTYPATSDGPGVLPGPTSAPDDGRELPRPPGWGAGYLDAIEWRWVRGVLAEPGPGVAWMRPRLPLVEGEAMTGLQRLVVCVDSASGVSAALDIRKWAFLNTELTVNVLREPVGDWICLDAETTLGPGSVGLAVSTVSDVEGVVGRSSQTLLVSARPG